MATATPSVGDIMKDLGNMLYASALIATATVGSRYLTTKVAGMKDRPVDFKLKSLAMLTLDIGVGSMVVGKLQDNGVPKKIFN